jgi:ABC-type cobalamin/Fe3+-siderophores transport system ATPase subunit
MNYIQLINFSDNKLVLNNVPIDYDAKVITVIGKARLGKSSLLNIICSYINDKDQNIFKSSASIHHVTQGISYYYIEKHKILLIDSQGLDYANSSDDHKIMLLCYSISNIIIFNERTMFNNSSLMDRLDGHLFMGQLIRVN